MSHTKPAPIESRPGSGSLGASVGGAVVGRLGSLWADAACLAVLAFVAVTGFTSPDFSPDSWTMYELSKHIFDDFYRVNTYRQFQFNSPYGVSFAPLYPVLLATARLIYDAGIYTGLFLNTGIAVLTLWRLKRLATTLSLPAWAGNLWLLILLANFDYCDEMIAGRTLPLAILLLTLLLQTWVDTSRRGLAQPARLGVGAGLLALTRFEFLLVSLLFGAIGHFTPNRWNWRQSALYYVLMAAVVSPWCVYSLSHFGKPLISDNSRTVLSAERTSVMDYFEEGKEPPTVKDAPVRWIKSVLTQRLPSTVGATLYITYRYFPVMLLAGVLAGLALSGALSPRQFYADPTFRLLLWFGLVLSSQIAAVCLTGYKDLRYFIPFTWYSAVVCTYVILRCDATTGQFAGARKYATPLLALLTLGCFVREYDFRTVLKRWPPRYDAALTDPAQYEELTSRLHADLDEPRLLVLLDKTVVRLENGNIQPGFNPFRFGALTGDITLVAPGNLTPETFPSFAQKYDITHVFNTDPAWIEPLQGMGYVKTPMDGLYRAEHVTQRIGVPLLPDK